MNSDILSLANNDFESESWDDLFSEKPDVAEALHYLLLMEKHGGRDSIDKERTSAEVSELVAKDMKYSTKTLAVNRRKWTNSGALAEARSFLQPIRAEHDAALADMVKGQWEKIVRKVLKEATKEDNNIYAIIAAAQWLKNEVLAPAAANQIPSGNEEQDYIDRVKTMGEGETIVEDEEDYLSKQ